MVDCMFSNIDNIKDFYPNAEWNLVLESNPIKSTNLRPDTVIVWNNKTGKKNVYIIDAKYYRYGTTFLPSDLPETTSLQKQITYGEYVKAAKQGQYSDVYSASVLPYSKYSNINKMHFHNNFEYVGIGRAKWFSEEETEKTTHRKIAAILIDTKFLVNNRVTRNDDNIDKLVELIEAHNGF